MTKQYNQRGKSKSGISIHLSLPLLSLVLMLGLWAFSSVYKTPPLFLSDTYHALASRPHSPTLHIELAKKLQTADQISHMKKEIDLSINEKAPHSLSTVTKEKNVLGTQTSINEITEMANNSQKQILYWESVISNNPNFRDAYVQMAILTFNAGDLQKSNIYVQKAMELDPNYVFPPELIKN